MSAPTEEEIRAELARAWRTRYPDGSWPENDWVCGWTGGIIGMGVRPWNLAELRPSELDRLDTLVEDSIRPIREEAERRAIEALVGALVAFAQEHPDAPRAPREAVSA